MRELKTIKCTGDVIQGDIFETLKDERWELYFRIDKLIAEDVAGKPVEKIVRSRHSLESLKEMRKELDAVIERMEEEL